MFSHAGILMLLGLLSKRAAATAMRASAVAATLFTLVLGTGRSANAATLNNSCYVATGAAAHVLCWLDLTGYGGTGTTTIAWKLPDGSTLSGSLQNAATTSVGTATALPTYSQADLGNTVYTGIAGKPAIYAGTADAKTPLTFAGLQITNIDSSLSKTIEMVGADAESTDSGDGSGTGYVDWSTTGGNWAVLQHTTSHNQGCTIALSGATAQCLAPNTGPPSDIYLLQSLIASGQSIAMSYNTTGADNGYAVAVELATLDLSKTITARVGTTDQFTIATSVGTHTAYTAATTGTATTATTGVGLVVPGTTYTLTETASNADLNKYASSIACTNATAGSATVLPSGIGTTFSVTPAVDDRISCTFNNSPLPVVTKTVTNVTHPNGTTSVDTAVPKDDLQYGLTFTNDTGVSIVATAAKPIVITDSTPTDTTYLKSACTTPQNGLTCTISAPAVGATGAVTFTFVGTLASGQSLTGTFDVSVI